MTIGSTFKLKSILLGVATSIILARFIGFVIGFSIEYGYGLPVLLTLVNSTAYLIFGLIVWAVICGFAGWFTAQSARVNKLGNALVMSIAVLVLNAWFYSILSVQQALWYIYTARLLTIPAALVGAYLEDVLNSAPSKR